MELFFEYLKTLKLWCVCLVELSQEKKSNSDFFFVSLGFSTLEHITAPLLTFFDIPLLHMTR